MTAIMANIRICIENAFEDSVKRHYAILMKEDSEG